MRQQRRKESLTKKKRRMVRHKTDSRAMESSVTDNLWYGHEGIQYNVRTVWYLQLKRNLGTVFLALICGYSKRISCLPSIIFILLILRSCFTEFCDWLKTCSNPFFKYLNQRLSSPVLSAYFPALGGNTSYFAWLPGFFFFSLIVLNLYSRLDYKFNTVIKK